MINKDTSKYIAFNSYGGFNETKDEYHKALKEIILAYALDKNVTTFEETKTVITEYRADSKSL